jgi:ADP-ribose pyrophosphatase YjhB (NUDIX family)
VAVQGSDALWTRRNRLREVCMVIRRPSGRLLTFTKAFYPPGLYRLLSGGVEPGEGVLQALQRELAEETGLECTIARFLAVVEYRSEEAPLGPARMFTFAFLVDERGGTLRLEDDEERLAGYGETDVAGLAAIADQLDALPDRFSPDLGESWREWGAFRAVVHRVVRDALTPGPQSPVPPRPPTTDC